MTTTTAIAPIDTRVRPVRITHAPSGDRKSIWGGGAGGFYDFMGIRMSDDDTIEDSPADYSRAVVLEPFVLRCVAVKVNNLSKAPLRVYELDKSGERGDAVGHESLDLLRSTNPFTGQVRGISQLMGFTLGSVDLHGYGAWQLASNGKGGKPTEIYWLPPASFTPVPDAQGGLAGIRKLGEVDLVTPDRVAYFRSNFNFATPLAGVSKIAALKDSINLRRLGVRSNKSFFENSMRPDVVVSGDWPQTPETMQGLRSGWESRFVGEHNRSPLFLGGKATAHLLTVSPKDAEWINQQRLSGEEISMAFGVPVIYLNNYERATYENVSTAKLMLWHDGIMPDADSIVEQLTREFLWRFWPETTNRLEFAYDYSEVEGLGEDVDRVIERAVNVLKETGAFIQDGTITRNAARPILKQLYDEMGLPSEAFDGDIAGGNISEVLMNVWREYGAFVQDHVAVPNQVRPALAELSRLMGIPHGFDGPVPGGDTTLDLYNKIPTGQHSVQAVIDVMAARGENPELVEDVPGAENAGKNAQAAAARRANQSQATNEANRQRPEAARSGDRPQDGPQGNQGADSTESPTAASEQAPAMRSLDIAEFAEIIDLAIARALKAAPAAKTRPHPGEVRERRLGKHIEVVTRDLKKLFQAQQTESLKTLRAANAKRAGRAESKTFNRPDGELFIRSANDAKLQDVLNPGYLAAMLEAYDAAASDYGLSVSVGGSDAWLEKWLGLRLPLMRGINLTTQQAITEALDEAVENGEDVNAAADRISAVFRSAIDSRAEMIARTELMQAYGNASISAYRDGGVQMVQMYDGSGDPECAARNGQIVSVDEGEAAMGDEHPNGTLVLAPVVEMADLAEAASFNFDGNGVAVA